MSVLIKGVKMPKGCYDCPCCSAPMRDISGNLHYSCTLPFNGLYGRTITKNVYREEEPRPNVCPLIEVPERKVGKWVDPTRDGCITYDKHAYAECSACGEKSYLGRWMRYCPNCGAEMEGASVGI